MLADVVVGKGGLNPGFWATEPLLFCSGGRVIGVGILEVGSFP